MINDETRRKIIFYLTIRNYKCDHILNDSIFDMISNNHAIMTIQKDEGKKYISTKKLRVIIRCCLLLTIKKLYLILDSPLKNQHVNIIKKFHPYLDIQAFDVSFFSVVPGECIYDKKIIRIYDKNIIMSDLEMDKWNDNFPIMSRNDILSSWYDLKSGDIVKVNGIYKIIN